MADVTQVYHRHVYPAIAPSNFDFTGKTILVFGVSSLIGQAIAASFVQARAEHVVCVNRNPDALRDAMSSLEATLGKDAAAKLSAKQCDMTDEASVNNLWQGLDAEGIKINVLVLVAADFPKSPMFKDGGLQRTLRGFTVNVEGCTRIVDGFVSHNTQTQKVLLNISTAAAHLSGRAGLGAYGASKMGFSTLLQQMAVEYTVDELQIINIHPGAIYTNAAREAGYKEDSLLWDDADLPGQFCVWAASPHASFLHGRFVWAHWDVEELVQMKPRFDEDNGFLKLGLQGIPSVDFELLFKRIAEKTA